MGNYNDTNKKSFVHRANKKRTSESDVPDKFRVASYLKKNFGLYALTEHSIPIRAGFATRRHPDLLIKQNPKHSRLIAVLLHGGVHGWGDEISRRNKDKYAAMDYKRENVDVIEIYSEQTENYAEHHIIEIFVKLGFKWEMNL